METKNPEEEKFDYYLYTTTHVSTPAQEAKGLKRLSSDRDNRKVENAFLTVMLEGASSWRQLPQSREELSAVIAPLLSGKPDRHGDHPAFPLQALRESTEAAGPLRTLQGFFKDLSGPQKRFFLDTALPLLHGMLLENYLGEEGRVKMNVAHVAPPGGLPNLGALYTSSAFLPKESPFGSHRSFFHGTRSRVATEVSACVLTFSAEKTAK